MDPKGHSQGPIVPIQLVGSPPRTYATAFSSVKKTCPAPGDQVIDSETIHHTCTMVANGAIGGMGYPLVILANGSVLKGGQGI